MTVIDYKFEDASYTLIINGHAGDARVCAGVSTLAYTLHNCLVDLGCEVFIKDDFDGVMVLVCNFTEEQEKEVATTCKTIHTGFYALAENHPQNVVVNGGE